MTTAITNKTHWDEKHTDIIKKMFAKDLNKEELELYSMICEKLQLDPIAKQIYAIKRKQKINGKEESVMTILTSIDGYRIIAERTDRYAPGDDTILEYDEKGNLLSAKVFVKKMTADGTWHQVSAVAFMKEYKPTNLHYGSLWTTKPSVMIEKCAEARALRRCFPKEYMGVYIQEEMDQAETHASTPVSAESDTEKKVLVITQTPQEPKISEDNLKEIRRLVGDRYEIIERINQKYGINSILNIKQKDFDDIIKGIKAILKKEYGENHAQ